MNRNETGYFSAFSNVSFLKLWGNRISKSLSLKSSADASKWEHFILEPFLCYNMEASSKISLSRFLRDDLSSTCKETMWHEHCSLTKVPYNVWKTEIFSMKTHEWMWNMKWDNIRLLMSWIKIDMQFLIFVFTSTKIVPSVSIQRFWVVSYF